MGGSIRVQNAASTWMRNNLDIDIDELPVIEERQPSSYANRVHSGKQARRQSTDFNQRSGSQSAFKNNLALSEANLHELNGGSGLQKNGSFAGSGRPMSAATYTTQMASHMSRLPELSSTQVMSVARTLF